jgi:Ran-binding protein 1
MSDTLKPDPAANQAAAPGATLVQDETAKVTTDVAAKEDDKPVTEKVTDAASSAATTVKDGMFSMFGGGPAKVKKEEVDDTDEPSGASKPKETVRVRYPSHTRVC